FCCFVSCFFHRLGFWSLLLRGFFCFLWGFCFWTFISRCSLLHLRYRSAFGIQVNFTQYGNSQLGSLTGYFFYFWLAFLFLLHLRSLFYRILFFWLLWFRFSLDGKRLVMTFADRKSVV